MGRLAVEWRRKLRGYKLLGLEYWSSMTELGISLSRAFAFPMFESGESWGASVGVRIISAPAHRVGQHLYHLFHQEEAHLGL
jgi:hypothetical protein